MSDEQEPAEARDEPELDTEEASRLLDEIESELEALSRAIARIGEAESSESATPPDDEREVGEGDGG